MLYNYRIITGFKVLLHELVTKGVKAFLQQYLFMRDKFWSPTLFISRYSKIGYISVPMFSLKLTHSH